MENDGLSRYLAILRKRAWMILLIFAVTMTAILISALTAKPVYQAAVRLQVIPVESEQVTLYSQARTPSTDVIDLIGFEFNQLVRSSTIAWRTISQLGLDMSAETLLSQLDTVQEYGFLTVIAGAETPEAAEAIVTAQVDNALATYRTDQSRPAAVSGEFIADQLAKAEKVLSAARAGLLQFKLSHSVDSLDREITAYQDSLRSLRSRQEDAALSAAQLAAQIAALETEAGKADEAAGAAAPDSEAWANATSRATRLRDTAAALRGDLAGARALQADYDRAVAKWETDLTSLLGLSEEYTTLTSNVAQAQSTRDFLFDKALEAQLKQRQAMSVGYLKVVEPARRPDQPLPSRTLQIALLGGLLSLVVGAALAFLFELIETLTLRPKSGPKEA
jgi:uncharacterized protein involved in exopolysaccharide biosynthesis